MKRKILFIASLPNKNNHFNGETNKSKDVLKAIEKFNFDKIDIVDYTKNKYVQTIKMILLVIFKKYDYIFVSKCITGGSFAIHLIRKFARKANKNHIYFYLIGNGYQGFEDKNLYFQDLIKCEKVIVESPMVKKSMMEKGLYNVIIFPCVKPNYDIDFFPKKYEAKSPLKLIFFSRIVKEKGIEDLINAVIKINKKHNCEALTLDVSGGYDKNEEGIRFAQRIEEICKEYSYLNYLGESFSIEGQKTYVELQKYDLHVLPTRFIQECAPGSIIDMFIAGVPTLSSTFPSAKYLMNEENSFFFEQLNYDDLVKQLESIYLNPQSLTAKRRLSFEEAKKYTLDAFVSFLKENDFK